MTYTNPVNENAYELAIIELFQGMGWDYVYGPSVNRDFKSPLYEEVLQSSLYQINGKRLPEAAIEDAIKKLKNIENGSLIQKNKVFMDYLQNGIDV